MADQSDLLAETLPDELDTMQLAALMHSIYPTAVTRLGKQHVPSHPAPYNRTVKLYNEQDVIALLRLYRVPVEKHS